MKHPKVIHLIPRRVIGGVENAALSVKCKPDKFSMALRIRFISSPCGQGSDHLYQSFLSIPRSVLYLLRAKPSILIVSLWRSCVVALIVKILCPRLPIVLFLHSPRDEHFADFLSTFLCSLVSSEIWFDSKQTSLSRFVRHPERSRIISYLPSHITPHSTKLVTPDFIFWGRLHAQKNLPRSLVIFAAIQRIHPSAKFCIVGPDCGELPLLRRMVLDLGVEHAVSFAGPLDFDSIHAAAAGASFYLQTSSYEGMAISVIEAMQIGLVPVVTPVGEISRYAMHRVNSITVNDHESAVIDIMEAIENNQLYQSIRLNAISTWRSQPTYSESFLAACGLAIAEVKPPY